MEFQVSITSAFVSWAKRRAECLVSLMALFSFYIANGEVFPASSVGTAYCASQLTGRCGCYYLYVLGYGSLRERSSDNNGIRHYNDS